MTLTARKINLSFVLGEGAFGEGNSNAVDITGLRVSCQISRAGGVSMSSMTMRVWGLPLEVMQKLSVLNILAVQQYRRNIITVTAGDDLNGYGVAFSGEIIEAWVDANSAPDVCFAISATEGRTDAVRPVIPTSFKGPTSIDTLLSSIARQMQPPRAFENNGVNVVLDNSYYPGTLSAQIQAIVDAAQCEVYVDNDVLAVWPIGQSREGALLDMSAETGLVGYPQFASTGVTLTALYNPALSFGRKIRLRSALGPPADGDWVVLRVVHNLDSELPGGQWFTSVDCGRDGYPTPIIN